jgi:hypothetical protein
MLSPFLATGRLRPTLSEAPVSGQNSRALLREVLDMPDNTIDALVADGIIAEPPPVTAPPPETTDLASIRRRLGWRVLAEYDPDPGCTLDLPRAAAQPSSTLPEVAS